MLFLADENLEADIQVQLRCVCILRTSLNAKPLSISVSRIRNPHTAVECEISLN